MKGGDWCGNTRIGGFRMIAENLMKNLCSHGWELERTDVERLHAGFPPEWNSKGEQVPSPIAVPNAGDKRWPTSRSLEVPFHDSLR